MEDFFSGHYIHPYEFTDIKSIASDGNTIWIVDLNEIKTIRNGIINTFHTSKPLGPGSHMILDLVSRHIIVCLQFNNQLAVIDMKTGNTELIGSGKRGFCDGTFEETMFFQPFGLALDSNRNILLCDSGNCCVRVIDRNTRTVTSIGKPFCKINHYFHTGTCSDGSFTSSTFTNPTHILCDRTLNTALVLDNDILRKIDFTMNTVGTVGRIPWRTVSNMMTYKGKFLVSGEQGMCFLSLTESVVPDNMYDSRPRLLSIVLDQITYTSPGLCLDEWNNFVISTNGKQLVTLYTHRSLQWKHARLIWIGHLKENRNSCVLAMVPRDIIWVIIGILLQ